ncbi:MAG: transketolase [Legionellales bacterium]|nr:transketolase [Legionellales bacterium]
MKPLAAKSLDELCVNTLRTLSIDAIQQANSGHPGLPLGAAPMAYVLWTRYLKHNPANPQWYDRDRFVLSAGHGSMLLYSLLHLTGYAMPIEQIKQFRQWGSLTPGHPESELTPGVEVTTGPLGQGFANGVGMAIAEAYLAARYNQPDFNIIDHFTYAIVSDGDLMEGVASEAASLAGHLKLGKLIYLYDNNHITLSASTYLAFTENCQQRFDAYGWHTQIIEDGNNLEAIDRAIEAARQEVERPSLILIKTCIGYGSPHKQNTFEVHGSPLGVEEVKLTKQYLGWPEEPLFYIPQEAKKHFHKAVTHGHKIETEWQTKLAAYEKKFPDAAHEFHQLMNKELAKNWNANIPLFPADPKGMATRDASGKVMQAINPNLPGFIGGSADLNPSTKTELINFGNFQSSETAKGDLQGSVDGGWNYTGRNLYYGVREHAMGAISNGLAAVNGMIPFAATFLIFSDYMRPAIRLAALMKSQVIYVFTHDSLALGEDGPTHQPVEQLASLRAIPQLIVIRPADANETAVAWQVAIETRHNPVALILTRQAVPTLDRKEFSSAEGLRRGAYILADAPKGKPSIILIATGSEVALIVSAQQKLQQQNIGVRIVSMPSWALFEAQSQQYRNSVLPPSISLRLVVEAGVSQGWERYIGDNGDMISIETFGASASGTTVMQHYGFSVENICKQTLALLKKS